MSLPRLGGGDDGDSSARGGGGGAEAEGASGSSAVYPGGRECAGPERNADCGACAGEGLGAGGTGVGSSRGSWGPGLPSDLSNRCDCCPRGRRVRPWVGERAGDFRGTGHLFLPAGRTRGCGARFGTSLADTRLEQRLGVMASSPAMQGCPWQSLSRDRGRK